MSYLWLFVCTTLFWGCIGCGNDENHWYANVMVVFGIIFTILLGSFQLGMYYAVL